MKSRQAGDPLFHRRKTEEPDGHSALFLCPLTRSVCHREDRSEGAAVFSALFLLEILDAASSIAECCEDRLWSDGGGEACNTKPPALPDKALLQSPAPAVPRSYKRRLSIAWLPQIRQRNLVLCLFVTGSHVLNLGKSSVAEAADDLGVAGVLVFLALSFFPYHRR